MTRSKIRKFVSHFCHEDSVEREYQILKDTLAINPVEKHDQIFAWWPWMRLVKDDEYYQPPEEMKAMNWDQVFPRP